MEYLEEDESVPQTSYAPTVAAEGWNYVGVELEAQRAARAAVLSHPLFPELERRLIRVLGPTPEAIMLHQMIYWFNDRKHKMKNRWALYKTFKEWRDERGLNRKQVEKGRKRLKAHESKVVEEKKGPYKRIYYRINWVRLAELLEIFFEAPEEYEEVLDVLEELDEAEAYFKRFYGADS